MWVVLNFISILVNQFSQYLYKTHLGDPLPSGSQIGQLNGKKSPSYGSQIFQKISDEYPTKRIVEFAGLGPKAYALLLEDLETGEEEIVKHFKGLKLNYEADEKLSFNRIREMALNTMRFSHEPNTETFNYHEKNFRITKEGNIMTVPMTKVLRPTFFKGVRRNNTIVPFGYVHNA
jgi:hypothetical protein